MLSKELLKKIKHIEIKSNRMVDEVFSGGYRSSFKGKGMEFEDIREYYPGDDVRAIDWNVTARHNKAYVKQFNEERELNIFLVIDMSSSNLFGHKKDLIAEISATLSFSAIKNNDQVGAILFTDQVEKVIPSKKGKSHALSIIDTLLTFEPKSKGTNIENALEYFIKFMKKKSVLFVVSDFMDTGFDDELKRISKKHDVILVQVIDPNETELPKGAIFTFEDLETGKLVTVDRRFKNYQVPIKELVDHPACITIRTDEDYILKFKHFFAKRVRL